MRRFRHHVAVSTILVALFILAGCGGPREQTALSTSAPVESPEEGGRVLLRIGGGLNTLNPVLRTTAYELTVLGYLFDGLIELDRELNPVGGLATSWNISDDGLTYTLDLDPLATWSDGTPVTAGDVVFTLEKYKTDSPLMSGYFEDLNLDETTAIDDHTVRVVFNAYHAGQIYTMSMAILPKHVYSVGDFKNDFNDLVVGNGPYRLVRREAGSEILLERREDYAGPKPHIREVLLKVIPDTNGAWNALTTGEIDEMRISSEQWDLYANDPEALELASFHQFYELSYNFVAWNNRKAPLDDVSVRRALTLGIDREAVVEYVYNGGARIMTGPYTREQWAYNPEVAAIPFDPEEAQRLLDKSGWTDENGDGIRSSGGKPLTIEFLVTAGDRTSVNQGQIYQDELKKIGVDVRLRSLELTTLIERVLTGNFEAVFLGYSLDLDPDLYANFHSSQFTPTGSNWVFYSNPEIDRLLEEGQEARVFEERQRIYQKVHEILAHDQPVTWLVQPSTRWAVRRRLRSVEAAPGLGFFGWQPGPRGWWIPKSDQKTRTDGN